ncbi:methionyl-tRNA synthetase [Heterostelium album PN500]|uniref:methionine--tRNA ligase n=1 Tax=Heterostelium pallidum (strain ATCC 26659 / Pp 5 / PN500) TaxID=670386 RepID=D3BAM8_HETP5|nr:methionyl-tRNA synthetase [Heterostelium album PN500]EFA81615.1 methionyl-tRNA synthetase [Heterostelium album PN500]|eukprot:XP_020433732.1 methionyl-tRNA synthetase [Heterostelium album PN500]
MQIMSAPPSEVVLPVEGQRNILITSALPYVNNVPHLGNIIGCVLSGDVYARYCRMRGYNTIYICGTDEYGTATETKALQEGVTPKEICDRYHVIHRDIYKWFNIGFDKFGRTSTDSQTEIAQDIFMKLYKNELTTSEEIEQLYCERCNMFLADRYVEGTCPHCQFEDARGDQCDNCTKMLNPTDLIRPRCKLDSTTPVLKSTKHIFLSLPKIQQRLDDFVTQSSPIWSENSQRITNSWVKGELKSRCITRDLKWGTPVPLEEFKEKVFYVWFDAPIGYLSITKEYTEQWEQWWKNPKNVELVQFMGKDNVPFHTVIFPSSLIGSGDQYTLLHNLSTTEYLNYESGKFSKSRNTGVFGDNAMGTGVPADIWRYYLLSNRPEKIDSTFSWADFGLKTNTELLSNFGNLVNRVLKQVSSDLNGVIPKIELNDEDRQFIADVDKLYIEYLNDLEHVHIKDGLRTAMSMSKLGNQYMQSNKPWELKEKDPLRFGTILTVLVNTIKLLATVFEPYLPEITAKVHEQLNMQPTKYSVNFEFLITEGHAISKNIVPLINKIENTDLEKFRSKFSGPVLEEFPLDLQVAQIKEVADHPTAESLYVLKAELAGGAVRTVVAGLKATHTKEQLLNKKIALLLNLKPAKFQGVASEGMVVVADNENKESPVVSLLLVADNTELGTKINVKGMKLAPKPGMDYVKGFKKLDLKVKDGEILFKGAPIHINNQPLTLEKPISTGILR